MATTYPWQPRRWLPPDLARAVANAKAETGITWRELARIIGVSHSHLLLISQGRRVPSTVVVELMAEVLPIDPDALDALRDIAVVGHGRSRHGSSSR